jgi:segregation and condensation protein B
MDQPETPSQTDPSEEAVETTDEVVDTPDQTVDTPEETAETTEDVRSEDAPAAGTPEEDAAAGAADERREAYSSPGDEGEAEDTDGSAGDKPSDQDTQPDPAETAAVVEAILFATSRAISISKIQQVAELPNRRVVKDAILALNERYDRIGSAFRIESIAGGYQVLTREEYDDVVSRLFKVKSDSKLSSAAMETLSIIAYRQPIMRADIEAIRGVSSGEMVRKLMEKNLVKIVGRAEVLGRPMLYGTTTFFLEAFGLSSIEDLPRVDELRPRPEPITKDQTDSAADNEEDGDPSAEATAASHESGESEAACGDEPNPGGGGEDRADQPSGDGETEPPVEDASGDEEE